VTPAQQVALRGAALGIVSGGRSTAGITAVINSQQPEDAGARAPLGLLTGAQSKKVAGALMVGEFIADKLPSTPSRLALPVLLSRVVAGAISAWALAQRHRVPVAVPAVAGGLGAALGSVGGLRLRCAAADRGIPDLPVALAEDALVLALAQRATA